MITYAVTSQNFRTITPHAGRTRRFLVYETGADCDPVLVDKLDLPKEQALHDWGNRDDHPVFDMDVVIAGSCGRNFVAKLAKRGIEAVSTTETDPGAAVRQHCQGTLPLAGIEAHSCDH